MPKRRVSQTLRSRRKLGSASQMARGMKALSIERLTPSEVTTMKPSEIRSLVLAEHADLRKCLAEIEAITAHVLTGHELGERNLREVAFGLCTGLEQHLAMEEALLLPAIREVDAWGPVRADHMQQEHQAQRAALARLLGMASDAAIVELARTVQAFARTLIEDMKLEEKELLNPNLLRDDVVSIDQFVG